MLTVIVVGILYIAGLFAMCWVVKQGNAVDVSFQAPFIKASWKTHKEGAKKPKAT